MEYPELALVAVTRIPSLRRSQRGSRDFYHGLLSETLQEVRGYEARDRGERRRT
jgi:hypothetical protein